LALLIVVLGNTVLNVALPTLGTELGASSAQLQWFLDGYILVFAALLLVGGAAGDRIGRRRAFTLGLTVFGMASVAATFATNGGGLIAARAFMGLGAALVMPTTLSIINDVFPDEDKPKAMVAWSTVASFGIALGPTIGGWMIDHFWWGSIFLVNVPVVLVAIIGAQLTVPESRTARGLPVDAVGALLSVITMGALVHGIIVIPTSGWDSLHTVLPLGAAALSGALLISWEARTPHPMMPLHIFSNPRFSAVSAALVLANFALMGMIFFYTMYTQLVMGFSAYTTGLTIIPAAASIALFSVVSARLHYRAGPKTPIAMGMGGIGIALLVFSQVQPDWPLIGLIGAQVILGAGAGLASTSATASLMSALPEDGTGVASAFNDITREVGALLGVAVLGSAMTAGYAASMTDAVHGMPPGLASAARDSFVGALSVAGALDDEARSELMAAATSAMGHGIVVGCLAGAAVAALGVLVAVTWVPGRSASDVRPEEDS
jgi:EmrB/QacA subfamily drug resistance transporter